MTTMHAPREGAKAFVRLFGHDAAQALEALTGRAPTSAQLATLGEAALSLRSTAAARCLMRPDLAPRHRALTFNRAGRLVADATLIPLRTVRFPDPCDASEAMETHRDKLTRCAGIRLAGCAAETYATGSSIHHQPAVSIAAFYAVVLGSHSRDDLLHAVMDFEDCAALAFRHHWTSVEMVEARLHAGQTADDILIHVARAPETGPTHPSIRALHAIGEAVTELALALRQAGDPAL